MLAMREAFDRASTYEGPAENLDDVLVAENLRLLRQVSQTAAG